MNRKKINKIIPTIMAAVIILSACNLPGSGGNTDAEAQAQTMSAQTVAAYLGQYLTQTAQATQSVIYVTATPLPTATNTVVPPTATAIPPTAVPPTKTPIPIPCNQAAFVDDITVDDGTSFIAGTAFTKTWRIQNTGSCTWGTGYEAFFYSGDAMSGPSSVQFSKSVAPGQYLDISVNLVAPGDPDNYMGNWMLRAPNGQQFGVGFGGGGPLTVSIKVSKLPKSHDANIVYDFVANYCDAEWRTNAGSIDCPGSALNFKNGSITRTYAPKLESGTLDDEGTIITIPAKGGDGMIQGQYPKYLVHTGDHILGTLLCSYKMPKCSVTFEILAQEKGSSTITSLGTWNKNYGDDMIHVDIDLSSMDGKYMIFYLKVYSLGDPTDDMAQWMAIRISHP
jgi:hypothetical protein